MKSKIRSTVLALLDRIEALTKEKGGLQDYANTRDVQIYDLRKALQPFADVIDPYDPSEEGDNTSATLVCGSITDYTLSLGDFRRARKALSGEKR